MGVGSVGFRQRGSVPMLSIRWPPEHRQCRNSSLQTTYVRAADGVLEQTIRIHIYTKIHISYYKIKYIQIYIYIIYYILYKGHVEVLT